MDKKEFRRLFGEWYKSKRIKSGKTMSEAGSPCSLSRGNVSDIENGNRGVTLLSAVDACESVGANLSDFIEYFKTVRDIRGLK